MAVVHFHAVAGHVEGDVGHVQEVVSKILLNDVPFESAADNEIRHPVGGVDFHDMPKEGLPADFHHRFRTQDRLFTEAGAETAGQDDSFGHGGGDRHVL